MDLVVDANVPFSAAIRDSKTAVLLLRDDVDYHVPEYIFEEFAGHRGELLEKPTGRRRTSDGSWRC